MAEQEDRRLGPNFMMLPWTAMNRVNKTLPVKRPQVNFSALFSLELY